MKKHYLAALTILASLCWLGSARAETLKSKLSDVVSATANAAPQAATQGQSSTAAPADATEREALTAEARDAAKQALPSSQAEQK